jgi:hypothetical protein
MSSDSTGKPPEEDKRHDADEAFAATLRNLVNTPHQPHAPLKPSPKRKAKTTR